MDFDEAYRILIGHEGGYVNHPRDPGGETKYGITKRSYPRENIRGMTLARAKMIYRRDFWHPIRGDALPPAVAFQVFDGAVNSGVKQSAKWLQEVVGVERDGMVGPITLRATQQMHPAVIVARYNGVRLAFMAGLPTWSTFGRGWARRIASNLKGTT